MELCDVFTTDGLRSSLYHNAMRDIEKNHVLVAPVGTNTRNLSAAIGYANAGAGFTTNSAACRGAFHNYFFRFSVRRAVGAQYPRGNRSALFTEF